MLRLGKVLDSTLLHLLVFLEFLHGMLRCGARSYTAVSMTLTGTGFPIRKLVRGVEHTVVEKRARNFPIRYVCELRTS